MVPAFYARKQIEEAHQIRDRSTLYEIVGLTPETITEPNAVVTADAYYALLETIAESEWPDPKFHMRVCARMRCEDFGAFGLAFKSAPTLRHAFQRLGRYTKLINPVSEFAAMDRGDEFCWTHRNLSVQRLGGYLSGEAALGTTLSLCRETLSPDLGVVRVQFAHHREGSVDALTDHFGVEPEFGADIDGMQISLKQIDLPTTVGDLGIWRFFTDHLEGLMPEENPRELSLQTRVVEEIAKLLSGGVPSLTEVSVSLGMGQRTLQRRLSEIGTSYQSLVDSARRQLAQQLVRETRYSLTEIAFLTGFSEQSAFTRAFKRWEGQSPRAYRQAGVSASRAG